MPAKSVKQQRFFGMVRAAQKGEGAASPEVAKAASSISKKDAKDFASTKHKGLPMKKEEMEIEEGMSLKDFKANRKKNERRAASADAEKRGHVGKEWHNTGRKYSPDEAKSRRAKMSDDDRAARHRSAVDPDDDRDTNYYSADKTKNPKKLRKQKAMGEETIREEDYDRMKDRRMERGGVDGNTRYPSKSSGGGAKKPAKDVGMTALELVKAQIRAKHGHGAIMDKKTKSEGYAPGDVDQKVGAVTAIPKSERDAARERLLKKAAEKRAAMKKEEVVFAGNYQGPLYAPHPDLVQERGDYWHPDPEKDRKLGGPGANQRAREDRAAAAKPKEDPKKLRPGESYMDYAKRQGTYSSPKKEGLRDKLKRKLGLNNSYSPEEGMKTYREFMAEGNRTGRMMQKSKTQVTGHISADRGDDEKANRGKRKELEKDLKKHGIGHKKGVGEYKYGSGETGREVSYQTSKPEKMSKRRFGKVMRRLGRKHGQESVITKDKDKQAKLHYTEKGSKAKSDSIGKTKAGKHPEGYGETSGTKVRGGKLPKKTTKGAYHYG